MTEATRAGVPVTLFLDYNCPYCYVASHRLERLAAEHGLDVLWRFVETQPGASPDDPGAPADRDPVLEEMISRAGLPWTPRPAATNTRRALLLAQTVQLYRRPCFASLHRALFHAAFAEARDIGDEAVLRAIAQTHGVAALVDTAWGTAPPVEAFLAHVEAARELELASVPSLVVSGRVFSGAASTATLEQALVHAANGGGPA